MAKVIPLDVLADRPTNNSSNRRRTQQWAVADTTAVGGDNQSKRCSNLAACLGFSKIAAPWWAASILPGDKCLFMTRDPWFEDMANRDTRQGAKQFAARHAKRRKRLSQIDQKVEVLVRDQRNWYVGRVVANDSHGEGGGQASDFLSIKFSNGSVLRNVRPSELRLVPRATLLYWVIIALTFVNCMVSTCLNLLAVEHTLRTGPHAESWLFPDRAFKRLPNTTLYNLTCGEVASASAHPEAWLVALLSGQVEENRHQSIMKWFLKSERHVLCWNVGWAMSLLCIFAGWAVSLPLRRIPTFFQIASLLCFSVSYVVAGMYDEAYKWSLNPGGTGTIPLLNPVYSRGQRVQQVALARAERLFVWMLPLCFITWFLMPAVASIARRQGAAHSVARVALALLLGTAVYWMFIYMRVVHFDILHQEVIDTDNNLERLALNMIYLETSMTYLEGESLTYLIGGLMLLYTMFKILHSSFSRLVIYVAMAFMLPLMLLKYAVLNPLPLFEPITWQLTHQLKKLPKEDADSMVRTVWAFLLWPIILYAVGMVLYSTIVTAQRVSTLGARTRNALNTWSSNAKIASVTRNASAAATTTKTIIGVHAHNYQPLNKRPPSQDVIRPIVTRLETNIANPSTRLHQTTTRARCCLALSTPIQVTRVLAVTGATLAAYMAQVVHGAGPGQREPLRETLVAVLEDLGCTEADREFVLDLADHNQLVHAQSSIGELREVVLRLGTKHRDQIYLRRMEGVGRETGFGQLVASADQVQVLALERLGGQVLRQTAVNEAMPWATGVLRLLDSACGVQGRYNSFMETLAVKSGGEFMVAPLKGLFRLSEKLWLRPTNNPDPQNPFFFRRGDCANVFDVVRGMIVCSSMGVLNICLGLLVACDVGLWRRMQVEEDEDMTAAQAAGITEELNVLRVKNRFKRPTSSGWADLLINFTFASDPEQHVCEVQLVHAGMLTARKHCNAHAAYAKFRSALELLETFGLMSPGDANTRECADTEQTEFVQTLEDEYQDFLTRYQQVVGIANESKNEGDDNFVTTIDDKSSHTVAESLEKLQEARRQDKLEYQEARRQDKLEYQRQLDHIQLQLQTLLKQSKILTD